MFCDISNAVRGVTPSEPAVVEAEAPETAGGDGFAAGMGSGGEEGERVKGVGEDAAAAAVDVVGGVDAPGLGPTGDAGVGNPGGGGVGAAGEVGTPPGVSAAVVRVATATGFRDTTPGVGVSTSVVVGVSTFVVVGGWTGSSPGSWVGVGGSVTPWGVGPCARRCGSIPGLARSCSSRSSAISSIHAWHALVSSASGPRVSRRMVNARANASSAPAKSSISINNEPRLVRRVASCG